ncbi:MAG: hypothetical protein GY816_04970 [Cytophagales bacterium]|nr:hypothetical protein [Cytophagales bacterium]
MFEKVFQFACVLILAIGCEVKPAEIRYGTDACHFCKMTIVDKQHSAEVVTIKGKAFKYDAVECMMNDLVQWSEAEPQLYLVADYSNPGILVDASVSQYLISDKIPSPMGAFLTAFEAKELRDSSLWELGGESKDWTQLRKDYNLKN